MVEDFLDDQQVGPITQVWLPFITEVQQTTSTLRMGASVLEALAHELNAANSYTQAHKAARAMQMTEYDLCFSLAEVLSDLTEAQRHWTAVLLGLKDLLEGEDSHP